MTKAPINLKVTLQARHLQTHSAFCREYDKVARSIDPSLVGTAPSRAQFHRWLSGELKGLPYPHHCRVLEKLCPGFTAAQLFERYTGEDDNPGDGNGDVESRDADSKSSTSATARPAGRSTIPQWLEFDGEWWASWQTFRDGEEQIATQPIRMRWENETFYVSAIRRGLSFEQGGYLWTGELHPLDHEILTGWYAATDRSVRAKGTIYLVVHPHGIKMTGRWVGLGYDDPIMTGWASIGRSAESAEAEMAKLIATRGSGATSEGR